MLKKEVRRVFKEKRTGISAADRMRWDDLLLIQFQALELPQLDYVLSFYPMEEYKEINTFIFTDFLRFRNPQLQICYPKMKMKEQSMEAIICEADTIFTTNAYGIPEPEDTDRAEPEALQLVLVPLLAFDERGIRVGYGKGFYDRYLKRCHPGCLKIGLSYFPAVEAIGDADEFDVPLDLCITPQRIYVF